MCVWDVDVLFTNERPIIVDQYRSRVSVLAESANEASLLAAQIVACHAEMVTRTEIVSVLV